LDESLSFLHCSSTPLLQQAFAGRRKPKRPLDEARIMTNKKKEGTSEKFDSCCKKMEVPSEDEVVALNAMRAIKERVRDLKTRLSEISSSNREEDKGEVLRLKEKLEKLKAEWNEWEGKRKKAAKERMIFLGHDEAS
jgi:chromosome segregation ATPase